MTFHLESARATLEAKTSQFLANGGKIQQIGVGESSHKAKTVWGKKTGDQPAQPVTS